jgi:L-serine dehydratase
MSMTRYYTAYREFREFMHTSAFELFSIGIGPSSSHTVGPMRAAKRFAESIEKIGKLSDVCQIQIELFGSLAMTGVGHGTDKAILLGLLGYTPQDVPLDLIDEMLERIHKTQKINILEKIPLDFDIDKDLVFHKGKRLPYHSNGMRFIAIGMGQKKILKEVYYSVGGGFIVSFQDLKQAEVKQSPELCPFPFKTFKELKGHCEKNNMTIADLMRENEKTWRTDKEIENGMLNIWHVMQKSIHRGMITAGILPGGLQVKRRAPDLYQRLLDEETTKDPLHVMDWASMAAIAVNEENAVGGRVVTAPTNGAAGVIPATLFYFTKFLEADDKKIVDFLLTAAAIGIIYKFGASLSAAEMGCQGEIGVASSMAAGALTAVCGGFMAQIENAAEIAMEHHLGMTCDPIGGLVQIPCIERNAMGVIKSINASRLALSGQGEFKVSLDDVVETMRQIGVDMHSKYKETSTGGLAINVPLNQPEC